jgi:hypothetical protein
VRVPFKVIPKHKQEHTLGSKRMRVEETTTVIMDVEEDGGKGVAEGGEGRQWQTH